jgi:hypothetical protein
MEEAVNGKSCDCGFSLPFTWSLFLDLVNLCGSLTSFSSLPSPFSSS